MAKTKTLNTEAVFRDLTRVNKKLRQQRRNPNTLRLHFTEFVTLSQKLTFAMYKEYHELTSQKWEARNFTGWTAVTELFKVLRNVDQHEGLIRIKITQTQVFEGTASRKDESGNEIRTPMALKVQMGYSSEAGFKKKVPGPFGVAEVKTGDVQQSLGKPDKTYFNFLLEGHTPEIETAIKAAGTENIHELAAECYKVLFWYYKFYQEKLATNRNN